MKSGVITYYIIAFLLFLVLWPLQMHHWLGEAFIQEGMLVKGELDFLEQRALPHYRGQPEEEEIKTQIDNGYNKVYKIFDKSIEYYPQYMETYYIVGRYYIDGGTYRLQMFGNPDMSRFEEGARVLRRDIYMNPNYKWAHNNLGVIYDKLATLAPYAGKPELAQKYEDLAREHYKIALQIDREQIFALYNLGSGYLREGKRLYDQGKTEEANEYLSQSRDLMWRSIRVQPNRADCYTTLAEAIILQNDYPALVHALEDYFSMLEKYRLQPDRIIHHLQLATGYLNTREPIPANEAARPDGPAGEDAPPLTVEERAARARDVLLEARRFLERSPGAAAGRTRRGDPPEVQVARLLGHAYGILGDDAKAAEEYERVRDSGVKDPATYHEMIRLNFGAGRPDRAREYLEEGLADRKIRENLYFRILADPELKPIRQASWFLELRDRYELLEIPAATDEAVAPEPKSGT